MTSAAQKSSVPTRKLIAAVIVVPLIGFGAPAIGLELSPEEVSTIMATVAMAVGYLVPPSVRDEVEKAVEKIEEARDES